MSLRTEGGAARGRSLVLSRRPRHQTCLLVHRRRQGKACAGRAGNFAAGGQSPLRRRTAPVRSLRSPMRAPNCRCRSRASSRTPASSRDSGRRRPSPVRSNRKMTSAPTRAMPAPKRSVVASRWPELAGINTPASPGPSTDNSAASAPENSGRTSASGFQCRTSAFRGRATGRRGRAPACRSGRIVDRKADRLGPDAADRHSWRTGACGPAGERDFQAQWPATERPSRRRSSGA